MAEEIERIALNARLPRDVITELDIYRRNLVVCPKGNPSVEKSLTRVFDHLQKLFEPNPGITE